MVIRADSVQLNITEETCLGLKAPHSSIFGESEALLELHACLRVEKHSLPTADQPCLPASFIQQYIQRQIDVMAQWEAQTSEHLGRCPEDLAFFSSHHPLGYDALSLL